MKYGKFLAIVASVINLIMLIDSIYLFKIEHVIIWFIALCWSSISFLNELRLNYKDEEIDNLKAETEKFLTKLNNLKLSNPNDMDFGKEVRKILEKTED